MCLEMDIIQRGLDPAFYDPTHLRKNIIRTCRSHPALTNDLNNASINVSDLINSLHISITNYEAVQKSAQFGTYLQSNSSNQNQDDQYFTDRQYRRDEYSNRRGGFRSEGKDRFRTPRSSKKCFVCGKHGCWSINHFEKERDDSKKRFSDRHPEYKARSGYDRRLKQYIADYESTNDSNDEDAAQYFDDVSPTPSMIDDTKLIEFESNELFLTSFDSINNAESILTTSLLADKAFEHRLTLKDTINAPINKPFDFTFTSTTESRYDDREFKNILVDCDAARRSTAEIDQFTALQRLNDSIQLDKSTAESKIQFDIDSTSTMGTTELNTPLGLMIFHIVGINTPFLLCLADLNRLDVYFNNLTNELVQKCPTTTILQTGMKKPSPTTILQTDMKNVNRFPIIRRYEHAFLLWKIPNQSLIVESFDENPCYLTEIELRRLHRRFGHPSARRLHQILERAEHDDVDHQFIEHLTKFCHHCQIHGKSPGRFSFTIRDEDIQFNFNILVNILYIEVKTESENKPVLHLMNEATRFQAGRWLKDISARQI
jgi:hypothetical protein